MKLKQTKSALVAVFLAAAALFAPSSTLLAAEPVQLRVMLDRDVLPSTTTEKSVVKISLEGARVEKKDRAPVNLALVIDRSGSMSGERIKYARAAAIEAVRRLSGRDMVSVVIFDDKVDTLVSATQAAQNRTRIEELIQGIETRGSTALYAGVTEGATQVRKNIEKPGYTHRVLLLSDGQANVGPQSPQELGELGGKLAREGISVSTVGVGDGYDEDLMTRLALRSDGNTYFAQNASMLSEIFDAELGDVLNVVARTIKITIHFSEGVRPLRFIGREGSIRGQDAELTINQVYGGQEKFALVEVEVAAGKDSDRREIAAASVSFEDARTTKKYAQKAAANASFSADKAKVIASANKKVQADYAEALLADAKAEAIALADDNKQKEAAARLRKTADDVKLMGDTYNNQAMPVMAQESRAIADKVEKQGISNQDRKQMRTDNAKTVNQQGK